MGRRLGHSMTSVSNVTNDLIPDAPNTRDIGSAAFPFKALYVEDQVVTDDIIFTNALTGVADNIGTLAALGTTQANAAPVISTVSRVTAVDSVKGVVAPSLTAFPVGFCLQIINTSTTATLKLYSAGVSELINGVAGTTAFIVPAGATIGLRKYDATNWYTTGLSQTADQTFGGNLSFAALKGIGNNIATLAALGTTQANAAPVISTVARVTGANGTVGVKLPALASIITGGEVKVVNSSTASALNVYSNAAGELISGQAGTTAISLAAKLVLTCTKFDATNWYAEKSVLPY